MRTVGDLDWERLGRYVRRRRDKELDMTQLDVQNAGGPSTATMRLIEGGHQPGYSTMTIAALETAMGWAPGSAVKILQGGEPDLKPAQPEPEPEPGPEPEPAPQNHYAAELQERYGLTSEGAEAAAVLIRALQRADGDSPDQSKKEA